MQQGANPLHQCFLINIMITEEDTNDEFEGDELFEDDEFEDDEFEDDEEPTLREGVKYPNIKVQLTGNDGNAFAIMGAVKNALRKEGVSREEQDEFMEEAMSGDYNNLLCTCMKWVDVR